MAKDKKLRGYFCRLITSFPKSWYWEDWQTFENQIDLEVSGRFETQISLHIPFLLERKTVHMFTFNKYTKKLETVNVVFQLKTHVQLITLPNPGNVIGVGKNIL